MSSRGRNPAAHLAACAARVLNAPRGMRRGAGEQRGALLPSRGAGGRRPAAFPRWRLVSLLALVLLGGLLQFRSYRDSHRLHDERQAARSPPPLVLTASRPPPEAQQEAGAPSSVQPSALQAGRGSEPAGGGAQREGAPDAGASAGDEGGAAPGLQGSPAVRLEPVLPVPAASFGTPLSLPWAHTNERFT